MVGSTEEFPGLRLRTQALWKHAEVNPIVTPLTRFRAPVDPILEGPRRMPESEAISPSTGLTVPRLSWWYSAIFGVAMIALIGTLTYATFQNDDVVEIVVVNEEGTTLPDASVKVNNAVYRTDTDGVVRLAVDAGPLEVAIDRPGYIGMAGTIAEDSDRRQEVALMPISSAPPASQVGGTAMQPAQEPFSTPASTEINARE